MEGQEKVASAALDQGSRSIVETFWKQSRSLPGGLTLSGYSRAADRSCFVIKEWKIFFDAGLSTYVTPAAIFITHSHCDHSFHLPMILVGSRDVPVYVPEPAHKWVRAHVEATYCLNQGHDGFSHDWYKLIAVKDREQMDLALPGKKLRVIARSVDHTVPCLTYFFSEIRKRLLFSLQGKSGKEIGELRKAGQPIDEEVAVPHVVYFGDTSIDGLLALEEAIVGFPTVIVESTFLYNEHRGSGVDAKKHIAWPELEPVVKRHPDITFIVIHFSMRYSAEELKVFFGKVQLPNVVPWI